MNTFQISGFVNYLSEIKRSENGTAYRNMIIGRGENEPSYSVSLFGAQARLAGHELQKGTKVKLTRVRLNTDTTTESYKEKKIANAFSLVATDWIVMEEWERGVVEAFVENGSQFNGFANYIKSGATQGGKASASLLLGTGPGRVSYNFQSYNDAAEVIGAIEKGSFVKIKKVMLLPVKDDTFKEKSLASKFFLAINEVEVRTRNADGQQAYTPSQAQSSNAAPQQNQPQPEPDFANFDDDIPF